MAEEQMNSYRLTSMEEPSDEMLEQLMSDAAKEARVSNEEATAKFFAQLKEEASKICVTW